MKSKTAMHELLQMDRKELQREVTALQTSLGQTRLSLEIKKEKNSANYRRDRRHLARLLTALGNSPQVQLPKPKSSRTVQAPSSL